MIYFDNAATGGFKPSYVNSALNSSKYLLANPARSGHRLAVAGLNITYKTRKLLCEFFNNDCVEKTIFTKNCTESLNMALIGSVKEGAHIITSVFEHNSVLRVLEHLKIEKKIEYSIAKPNENGEINYDCIKPLIKENTTHAVICHASNVTGQEANILDIGKNLKKDITFIVDGAQSAGHLEIDMQKMNIDILCVPAHKGLYGIMGGGALIFRHDLDLEPLTFGGTGTESFNFNVSSYPEKLEVGTQNLSNICCFYEGLNFVKNNFSNIRENLFKLTKTLILGLEKINGITVYSKENFCGIVSLKAEKIPSQELAGILNDKFDIAVRGGFHCAPLMHEFLKTNDEGLLRVSFCHYNSLSEVHAFLRATAEILRGLTF